MTKKQIKTLFFWVSVSLLTFSCTSEKTHSLVDENATSETKALFHNLKELSENHTLFGHQHATEYGHGWQGDENRSDVKSVTGSHPAVIGIDIMGFSGVSEEEIKKNVINLRKNVVDTYKRGGITTVAWHFSNPVSNGGFYWVDSVSFPGHKSVPNFLEFYKDPYTVFEKDLDNIYQTKK
jgi:mannan endo-1,4-beta-mannosidase